jgi:uncharacterized membrane protein YjjB (DUF3815 family)
MDFVQLLHHSVCGGVGAVGFAVLFNVKARALPVCAAMGALAVGLRTVALAFGWTMEAASFLGAIGLGLMIQLLPATVGVSRNAMNVLGVIPMIPGALIANAMLGLFAITATPVSEVEKAVPIALACALRVTFSILALGTGLAIPILLLGLNNENAE